MIESLRQSLERITRQSRALRLSFFTKGRLPATPSVVKSQPRDLTARIPPFDSLRGFYFDHVPDHNRS
jgi:hypothetical protein